MLLFNSCQKTRFTNYIAFLLEDSLLVLARIVKPLADVVNSQPGVFEGFRNAQRSLQIAVRIFVRWRSVHPAVLKLDTASCIIIGDIRLKLHLNGLKIMDTVQCCQLLRIYLNDPVTIV